MINRNKLSLYKKRCTRVRDAREYYARAFLRKKYTYSLPNFNRIAPASTARDAVALQWRESSATAVYAQSPKAFSQREIRLSCLLTPPAFAASLGFIFHTNSSPYLEHTDELFLISSSFLGACAGQEKKNTTIWFRKKEGYRISDAGCVP